MAVGITVIDNMNGGVMMTYSRSMIRQKMKQRIAELSRIYPYSRQETECCGQMLLSSYGLYR